MLPFTCEGIPVTLPLPQNKFTTVPEGITPNLTLQSLGALGRPILKMPAFPTPSMSYCRVAYSNATTKQTTLQVLLTLRFKALAELKQGTHTDTHRHTSTPATPAAPATPATPAVRQKEYIHNDCLFKGCYWRIGERPPRSNLMPNQECTFASTFGCRYTVR